MKRLALLLALLPLASACWSPGYAPPGRFSDTSNFPASTSTQADGPSAENASAAASDTEVPERPLIGWNDGVVAAPEGGSITQTDGLHGLGASDKGRMHILELYQGVIDERDALTDEVLALRNELAYRDEAKARDEARTAELEARIEELEGVTLAQTREIEELLGRLTTAQIRRLEAEKLVLETKLAEFAQQTEVAAGASR